MFGFLLALEYLILLLILIQKKSIFIKAANEQRLADYTEYEEMGDEVKMIFKIDKLRGGEGVVFYCPIRAEIFNDGTNKNNIKELNQDYQTSYVDRYNKVKNFLSSMMLEIRVYSPDFYKIEKLINIISLDCVNKKEVHDTVADMIKTSWDKYYPTPGFYLKFPFWFLRPSPYNIKSHKRKDYCEVIYSDTDLHSIMNKEKNIILKKAKYSDSQFLIVDLPPWGFFGDRFDLSEIGYKTPLFRSVQKRKEN